MEVDEASEILRKTSLKDVLVCIGAEFEEFLGVYMVVCPGSGEENHFLESLEDHSFDCDFCVESGIDMLDFLFFYFGLLV